MSKGKEITALRPATRSMLWMHDSSGKPSISVTMLAISFWVTTVAYILSMVQKIGPFDIRPFDPAASGAYLGLIVSQYAFRRYTETRYGVETRGEQTGSEG